MHETYRGQLQITISVYLYISATICVAIILTTQREATLRVNIVIKSKTNVPNSLFVLLSVSKVDRAMLILAHRHADLLDPKISQKYVEEVKIEKYIVSM